MAKRSAALTRAEKALAGARKRATDLRKKMKTQQPMEIAATVGGGSSHGRGLGLDLRTRDQSESNIAQMIAVSDALGFRPLREYTPPHLHLTLPPQEKKSLPWILAAGIALWTFTR